jgi:hypothetical protein
MKLTVDNYFIKFDDLNNEESTYHSVNKSITSTVLFQHNYPALEEYNS